MEIYFFNPQEWDRLYVNGCRHYDIDLHPLEERKHVFIGWTFIFQFFFYTILYIPCIFAIWKHMKHSCYKFMFVIGITDCLCMVSNAFFTGYFSITGQVFCSNPDLHYWVGLIGLVYVCWYFDPHVGYIDDVGEDTYHNTMHSIHNFTILFGVTSLYVVFLTSMIMKLLSVRGATKLSVTQYMTFFQVLGISFFNGYAAGLYAYLQYVRVTQFLMYTATYSWTTAHGLPCIIYILLNKTIRDDVLNVFRGTFKLGRSSIRNSSIFQTTSHIPTIHSTMQSTSRGGVVFPRPHRPF